MNNLPKASIVECEQQSELWYELRAGKATASKFDKIVTAVTGALSKGRLGYINELIAECYVKDANAIIPTEWMLRGIELEVEARLAFEQLIKQPVQEVGFCFSNDLKVVGCSPDGLIANDAGEWIGGVEIKCPKPSTHVKYLREGGLPNDYKQQVHGSMAVTGLDKWYFISYCPNLPMHVEVVHRDEYTAKVEQCLEAFVVEYAEAMREFRLATEGKEVA